LEVCVTQGEEAATLKSPGGWVPRNWISGEGKDPEREGKRTTRAKGRRKRLTVCTEGQECEKRSQFAMFLRGQRERLIRKTSAHPGRGG